MTLRMATHSLPTMERLYLDWPDFYGTETINRHLARYYWAASKLKSTDIVIDAGCGSGYGSFIILKSCAAVLGIDLSQEAINYATKKLEEGRWPKLEYRHGDLTDLEMGETFDAVVCIEVIEHLEQECQEKFMHSLTDIISTGGHLIITTPARGEGATTEFHRHEFRRREFKRFLSRFFKCVKFDDPTAYKIPKNFMLATCSGLI